MSALLISVSSAVHMACAEEAARMHPLETGGAFMGRRESRDRLRVTAMIGPGPEARHGPSSFSPDAQHHWAEMAPLHVEAGGDLEFLGDWHTHPRMPQGHLSWQDRRAVCAILDSPEAQAPSVITALLSGGPEEWTADAWVAYPTRRWGLIKGVKLVKAQLQVLAD